jgi:hypothetical protein
MGAVIIALGVDCWFTSDRDKLVDSPNPFDDLVNGDGGSRADFKKGISADSDAERDGMCKLKIEERGTASCSTVAPDRSDTVAPDKPSRALALPMPPRVFT